MELFSEYLKKEDLLSKIDARIKLILVFILLVMVLSYKGISFPLIITILSISLCLMIKIPLRIIILRFSEPIFIASILLLLKFLFSGEDPLFSINIFGLNIVGHKDGLIEGLNISSRIIGGVSLLALLGFVTPFTEFMAGLSWFRVPKPFIELLMLTYRYIFVLFEDAGVIYNAQKNRLGYSGIKKGLASFGTLTGALIIRAFEHSQKTSLAMLQRGYTGDIPMLKQKPFKIAEVTTAILFVVIMGIIWKI